MSDPHEPGAEPQLVERVLMALDDGVPAEVEVLARLLEATGAEVCRALAAVTAYRTAVERERRHGGDTAGEPVTLAPGTRLGDYLLDRVLGRGAMGVVYRARQLSLGDRVVALKVLPQALVARDPRFVERFRREASLAAAIHHPNLAEVYGFEASGSALCFAMRLVEGRTLHDVLLGLSRRHSGAERNTSAAHVRRCVMLCRGLADALAEIHARGLVHRDLKPANILLERAGHDDEEALLAPPVLVDFGLLRPAGESELTGTRTLLGTPAYASPETQLGRELGSGADVYSLGAVLHDLLTVTSPGTRGPATAGLPNVRAVNASVDARLAAIVGMALQERPELRYENGGAVRDELDRWLRGESIRALPAGAYGRLRLWVRRDPARAARAGALSFAALFLLLVVGWYLRFAWQLTAVAANVEAHERVGDLLGAAVACRELLDAEDQLAMLPWLRAAAARAEVYWRENGALYLARRHMMAAVDSRDPAVAEREFATAGDRLCELLIDEKLAGPVELVRQVLLREARDGTPEFRRRIALDTWANYLIVQPGEQTYPPELQSMLRALVRGGPNGGAVELATFHAAVAAYGAIRDVEVLKDLIVLLGDRACDLDTERLAFEGSLQAYTWIHRLQPEVWDSIDGRLMEDWAKALWSLSSWVEQPEIGCQHRWFSLTTLGRADVLKSVAPQFAFWECSPEDEGGTVRTLSLPDPQFRAAVTAARQEQAALWAQREVRPAVVDRAEKAAAGRKPSPAATIDFDDDVDDEAGASPRFLYRLASGRTAILHDRGIWLPGTEPPQLFSSLADANASSGAVDFEPINGDGGRPTLRGTVAKVSWVEARTMLWEHIPGMGRPGPGYLRMGHPGRSELHITTVVPEGAVGLTVMIRHSRAQRASLRRSGYAAFRLRIAGMLHEFTSTAPMQGTPTRGAVADELSDSHTILEVPVHLLVGRSEIELVHQYIHGNTTYRVMRVELDWLIAR